MEKKKDVPFTSSMSRFERVAALGYIPMHVYLVPLSLFSFLNAEQISDLGVNVVCYAIAFVFLLACLWRFFRREFDALCDYGPEVLPEVAQSYGVLLLCNVAIGLALLLIGQAENPNNAEVVSLAGEDTGMTTAVAVFLAPVVEEAMFRGGVFGLLRKYSRAAAYIGSVLLFALYHIWGYALSDPTAWLYVLQYLPAGILLARAYEKTNSLWTSIFLHMTVNGIAMAAISALGDFL